MKISSFGVISLIAFVLVIGLTGLTFADTGVPAVPEIQGVTTSTGMNVQGTATETDSGVWTLTNDPLVLYIYNVIPGQQGLNFESGAMAQLQSAGESFQGIVYQMVVGK